MEIIAFKYKKVADFCYELFEIAELPLHFSKFSNRIYSNYQKLFLLVYKQFRKFTYEELLTDIADNITLREYLGLNILPDYTTLIKFAKKLPKLVLEKLLEAFKQFIFPPKKVAIDATGMSLDNASPHYCKRIGRPFKKRPFLKASFIVDIEQYIILLSKTRKKILIKIIVICASMISIYCIYQYIWGYQHTLDYLKKINWNNITILSTDFIKDSFKKIHE